MKAFIALLLVVSVSGCASIKHSFDSDTSSKVYVGTKKNWQSITKDGCGGAELACEGVNPIVDLPFSLVMDTLLLPYTLTRQSAPAEDQKPASEPYAAQQGVPADGLAAASRRQGRG